MWWEQGGFLLVGACSLSPPQVSLGAPLHWGWGGGRPGLVSSRGSAVGLSDWEEAAGTEAEERSQWKVMEVGNWN